MGSEGGVWTCNYSICMIFLFDHISLLVFCFLCVHTYIPHLIFNDSYNKTVPGMLAKYPDVVKEENSTTSKWSWACGVILSRFFFCGVILSRFYFLVASVYLKYTTF